MPEPHQDHPPVPQLVVRVGVTGHREGPDLASAELRSVVHAVLLAIKTIAENLLDRSNGLYASDKPILRVISPLAEGADRLVAEVAISEELGYKLQVPMPFPQASYQIALQEEHGERTIPQFHKLLGEATAVFELDGSRETEKSRQEAYAAVGHFVLRHCDVLVTVWDGEPPAGPGGTGDIVKEALRQQIPTVRLDSNSPHSVTFLIPNETGTAEQVTARLNWKDPLRDRLENLLLPSSEENSISKNSHPLEEKEELEKTQKRGLSELFCDLLDKYFPSVGKKRSEREAAQRYFNEPRPHKWRSAKKITVNLKQMGDDILKAGFEWADNIATKYGDFYRNSYSWTYLLGAIAVLLAYLGSLVEENPPILVRVLGTGLLILELASLTAIGVIVVKGRKRRSHERWLDSRHLAESLRMMRVLVLFGRVTGNFQVPAHLQESDPRKTWFHWYFRSLVREAGMASIRMDEDTLKALREWLLDHIQGQIKYHADKVCSCKFRLSIGRFLAYTFFALAWLACVLHLFFHPAGLALAASNLAVIVLPAFAGAIGAIVHHSELERIERRSHALEQLLLEIKTRLEPPRAFSSQELGRLAESFSKTCLDELMDWRFIHNDLPPLMPS